MSETEDTVSPDTVSPVLDPAAAAELKGPFEHAVRLAEAVIFASREPVTARTLANLLPDDADLDAVMAAVAASYAGRGVHLTEVAGGWQFRTAADLAPVLRKIVELPRRLPRVAMETLSIVAYHQPVTRTEIEEIRGAALSQNTLDLLLENGLITPKGRRETPGRPTLWGTTPAFLAQFGLNDLRDLPKREELLIDPNPVRALAQTEAEGLEPPAAEPPEQSAAELPKQPAAELPEQPAAELPDEAAAELPEPPPAEPAPP
jgi:segregation and condensation protein B